MLYTGLRNLEYLDASNCTMTNKGIKFLTSKVFYYYYYIIIINSIYVIKPNGVILNIYILFIL